MGFGQKKFRRLVGLFAYVLAACVFVYLVQPTYLISILLVLGPPTLVNWLWLKRARRRVLIFALITVALFAPPVELASRLADAWDVQSVLPRPFGVMPLENLIFAFINFLWPLSFYAYFLDRDGGGPFPKRIRILVGLYLLLDLAVFGLFTVDPALVTVNYALMALPILVVPLVLIYRRRLPLLRRTLLPTAFFAAVFFTYETVSLCIGSWWWPGRYLMPVRLCGTVFPLDDVVIWYLLSTPALIGGYDYFVGWGGNRV